MGADRVHHAGHLGERRDRTRHVARAGHRDIVDAFAVLVDDGLQFFHVQRAIALELALAGDMHDLRAILAMRQIVGVVLHLRNQHHVAFGACTRQARRHAVEARGGAAAGEERAVGIGICVDELEDFLVRPFERLRSAARRVVQVGMGARVMLEELMRDLVGRRHH